MRKWIMAILVALMLALMLALATGCDDTGTAGSSALDLEATKTARDVEATRTTLDLEATKTAYGAEATKTAYDLERKRARARSIDAYLASLPWILTGVVLGTIVVVACFALPILMQRLGLVTRRAEDGEPILLLGNHRFALPQRSAGAYLDLTPGAERAPLLAESAEHQERATMRQQASNLALASQASEIVRAHHGSGDVSVTLLQGKQDNARLAQPSSVRVVESDDARTAPWLADVEKQVLLEAINDDD